MLDTSESATFIKSLPTHYKNIFCVGIQCGQTQIINKASFFFFFFSSGKSVISENSLAHLIEEHNEFSTTGKLLIKVFLEIFE